jgi:hypothetical protein
MAARARLIVAVLWAKFVSIGARNCGHEPILF